MLDISLGSCYIGMILPRYNRGRILEELTNTPPFLLYLYMPSSSKSQQRLFCMALAVRKGDLKRSDVNKSVLDIVDSDMTDKQIKEFTVLREHMTSLTDFINEALSYGVCTDNNYVFAVIKPGSLDLSDVIIDKFNSSGFNVYQLKTKRLLLSEARRLYRVHKSEPFYNDLCKYMSSGESLGILFTYNKDEHGENIFDEVTALKNEIREKYGESDMRNCIHASDSKDAMKLESRIYFIC